MMRILIAVITASLFCAAALGQSTVTPSRPVFEIADVHASTKSINTTQTGPRFRNGRYEVLRTTVFDLISVAYSMDASKVVGGPNWLDFDRFDIVAKAPLDTKTEALKLMLQKLLSERFHLSVHMEDRPQPQYALTLGKSKLQIKKSDGTAFAACRVVPQTQPSALVVEETACQNITMAGLAGTITRMGLRNGVEAPVVDATGLTGTWDVNIKATPAFARAAAGEGDTIFTAVEKLGLKLERRDAPMPVLVVDGVNEQPTPNPPGAQQALVPPKDPQFEVASIKPSAPGQPNVSGLVSLATSQTGRLTLRNQTLRNFITLAWGANNDAVIGLPKFADTDHFDVTAEAPASTTRPVDIETMRRMLRGLLADRFALAVHSDEQPIDVYVLTAPKPEVKMKRGNDAERGSCKATPEAIPPNSGLSGAFTCTNTTLPQFAGRLPNMASAYVDHPVVDLTGLGGTWDFVLMWTGLGRDNGRVNMDQPGDRTDALAQPGSLTVFEAIEKQLGLKVTLQKRPMPVLVIDHLDPKPTEN